ncbi:hypothetical protein ACOSP7_009142 [Xanthoceras sorbifolium]
MGFIIPGNVPTASPQPPLITPQTEMPTQDVDQVGYHFHKLLEIMGSRVTPSTGGDCRGNTGPSKKAFSYKKCANKGKESLLLQSPFRANLLLKPLLAHKPKGARPATNENISMRQSKT